MQGDQALKSLGRKELKEKMGYGTGFPGSGVIITCRECSSMRQLQEYACGGKEG